MDHTDQAIKSIGCYIIKQKISEFQGGYISLAEHQLTKQKVTIKILNKQKLQRQGKLKKLAHQIAIFKKIRHYTIIQLYQIIETIDLVYLVFEYLDGIKLSDYLIKNKKMKQFLAAQIFCGLIFALEYLKKMSVLHNNLKPSSIIICKDYSIKLINFQQSKKVAKNVNHKIGTAKTISTSDNLNKVLNPFAQDHENLGTILFQMLCGQKVSYKGLDKLMLPDHLNKVSKDMLTLLFLKSKQNKLNFQKLKQHPFLNKYTAIIKAKIAQYQQIDHFVINQLQLFGIQKKYLLKCMLKNQCNYVTTMYWLTKKKQMKRVPQKSKSKSPALQKISTIVSSKTLKSKIPNKFRIPSINIIKTKQILKKNRAASNKKFQTQNKRYVSNSEKKRPKSHQKKITIYSKHTDRRNSQLSQNRLEQKNRNSNKQNNNDYFFGSGLSQVGSIKQKKNNLSKRNSQIL